ncbi:MAG: alpha/beta hydrolase [Mucilaginibacter sp.]|uniref:alpha/beta fold hydrolase n=1 Tax=Mucilaginibacter sp. TaxID=1882438 RepID=UPI0031A24F4A
MNKFVLIHGSCQGSCAWWMVKEKLEKQNNEVINIELPGHGNTVGNAADLTLDFYRDYVADIITKAQDNVILVGHGFGGVVISAVAELIPEKISVLVYVAALLPVSGQSLFDLCIEDEESKSNPNIIVSDDNLTIGFRKEDIPAIFLNDCLDHYSSFMSSYCPEPFIPLTNPVFLTTEKFGTVSKIYIYALQDNVVTLPLQKQMVAAADIEETYSIDCGHMIQLANPEELTRILINVASKAKGSQIDIPKKKKFLDYFFRTS